MSQVHMQGRPNNIFILFFALLWLYIVSELFFFLPSDQRNCILLLILKHNCSFTSIWNHKYENKFLCTCREHLLSSSLMTEILKIWSVSAGQWSLTPSIPFLRKKDRACKNYRIQTFGIIKWNYNYLWVHAFSLVLVTSISCKTEW